MSTKIAEKRIITTKFKENNLGEHFIQQKLLPNRNLYIYDKKINSIIIFYVQRQL